MSLPDIKMYCYENRKSQVTKKNKTKQKHKKALNYNRDYRNKYKVFWVHELFIYLIKLVNVLGKI